MNTTTRKSMKYYEDLAIESLHDELPEDIEGFDPHDLIFEIADSCTPVYTSELMQLAADDPRLATEVPELGPAFDGTATPVNIVAANVFERIEAALWDAWRRIS